MLDDLTLNLKDYWIASRILVISVSPYIDPASEWDIFGINNFYLEYKKTVISKLPLEKYLHWEKENYRNRIVSPTQVKPDAVDFFAIQIKQPFIRWLYCHQDSRLIKTLLPFIKFFFQKKISCFTKSSSLTHARTKS